MRLILSLILALLATSASAVDLRTAGIKGTTTPNTPCAGCVGEVITTAVRLRSAALGLTTGTPATITSVTLGPGAYMLYGAVGYSVSGTTNVTRIDSAISLTTNASPAADTMNFATNGEIRQIFSMAAQVPPNDLATTLPPVPIRISSTTTYYLIANGTFTVSSMTGFGSLTVVRTN